MRRINTIIFDLDGLLIDSEKVSCSLYQELLKNFGHDFSAEEYARNYSGKTAVGNMDHLIKHYRLPLSVEDGMEWMSKREKAYLEAGIDLKPGAKELLNDLKKQNYRIILASSSTKERAVMILNHHQVADCFDGMVFGPEIQRGKPYPDIFLLACQKMRSKPEECLVLEDSEAGIQAAYAAKIPVICIPDMKRPGKLYEDMAVSMLPSLFEVSEFLKKDAAKSE